MELETKKMKRDGKEEVEKDQQRKRKMIGEINK